MKYTHFKLKKKNIVIQENKFQRLVWIELYQYLFF